MTVDVLVAMDGTPSHMKMPSASKLRPSPAIPGSMEAAIKMWLQVGNVQKLQQVIILYKELISKYIAWRNMIDYKSIKCQWNTIIYCRLFLMDTDGFSKTRRLDFLMSINFLKKFQIIRYISNFWMKYFAILTFLDSVQGLIIYQQHPWYNIHLILSKF